MKISFAVCLSCLLAVPAFAHSPTIAIPDNSSVTITRHSFGLPHTITNSTICAKPNFGSAYTPSKISIGLLRQDTVVNFFRVGLETYDPGDGRTCAAFAVSSDALDKYTVNITGTGGQGPILIHIFFQGPLSAIPNQ